MSKKIYGKNGKLAEILPGYKERPAQKQLSTLINSGIKDKKHVVVEAPTGSGKSIAALVPMLQRLIKDGTRKYVICTATIALQEQYIQKELPLMQKVGYDFTYNLIKGASNYICLYKFYGAEHERRNEATETIRRWLRRTETGDLHELTPPEQMQLAGLDIRANLDECLRVKCPHFGECPYFVSRNNAQESDVVVVNYHYLLSHMKLKLVSDQFVLLPRVTNILFDEAHVIKDLARDFFGYEVTERSLSPVIAYVNNTHPDTAHILRRASKKFFDMVRGYLGGASTRLAFDLNKQFYGKRYGNLFEALMQSKRVIGDEMKYFSNAIGQMDTARAFLKARRLSKQVGNTVSFLSGLERCLTGKDAAKSMKHAIWVEKDAENRVGVCIKPVNISGIFMDVLPKICNQATFMSATIDHDSFVRDLGLQNLKQKTISPVFNYAEQAALYVADLGEPNDAEYNSNVASLCADLVEMCHGAILCLFTSYKAMYEAEKAINKLPDGFLSHELLVQDGVKTPAYLANEFRKGDRVLLGTRSFFQGVDFPGECVKIVLINQLPFKHFEDPIVQTLKYFNSPDWFNGEQVPHVTTLFKQAFGRLIRRESDKGVVVCCDHRILSKRYGETIIQALPDGLPIIVEWDDFIEHLEKVYDD